MPGWKKTGNVFMRNLKFSIDSNFFQLNKVFKETKSDSGAAWLKRQREVFLKQRDRHPNAKACYFRINIEPVEPISKPQALPAVQNMQLVKASPFTVHIDGIAFTFHPKKRNFVSTDRQHSLTMREARGLYAADLLRIPPNDSATVKYLLAS